MAFNLDQVKNLFTSLKEKGTEYASVAADKTRDAARIAKLSVDLNTEKDNLKKAYLELGKAYFEENKDKAEGLFAQLCEEISAVNARIDDMQKELEGLKGSFKAAEAPDFEEVVASEEEEADITVEVVEEPCEACEEPTCDNCDVAAGDETPAEKTEDAPAAEE